MATLRADENRYLLLALPHERAHLARIPGARPLPGGRSVQLPRQAAVILALDRVLGPGAWTVDPDLAHEVAEARTRRYAPAEDEARIHLEGGTLAVECTIADKELVKQVPGYRWSPAQRRWYLAAMPLALDVLRDAFGDRLSVDREVEDLIAARRIDEARDADRASRVPEAAPPTSPAPASVGPAPPVPTLAAAAESFRDLRQLPLSDGLGPVLERLIEAVEGLTSRLDALTPSLIVASAAPPPVTPATIEPGPEGEESDWREILARSNHDAADALDSARRRIQTAIDPSPELRAVAGIAAWRAGETNDAFKSLKKALETGAPFEDGDLTTLARNAYVDVVLALISADCGPAEDVTSVDMLRELLHRELSNDDGFDDAQVAAVATGTLDLLVTDRALRAVSPALSDYCRILHLLSTARRATRMPSELVADVLRDPGLGADAFALGCTLYACVLQNEKSVSDWIGRWPGLQDDAPGDDGAWLVELALRRLGAASPALAGEAALAVLACIAAGPADQATLGQRRNLVGLIPLGATGRRYAEFLAMYRPAAEGGKLPLDAFPGYLGLLAEVPLVKSAPYLTEVYLSGEGAPGSVARAIADHVYVPALQSGGLTDADEQLFPLLDLLAAGSKPDQLLNDVGQLLEDGAFPGAATLDRADRLRVYRKALDQGVKQGHDKDSREAFFRLARAMEVEPDPQQLIELCQEGLASIKPLKLPAALTLLEVLLAEDMQFEEALDQTIKLLPAKGTDPFPESAFEGLQLAYPKLREPIEARLAEAGETPEVAEAPAFDGQNVLVVGGHQRLKAKAKPILERSGLKVNWLDSTEGKTGGQLVDLVKGACDLVVINAAYIGHAQSGRAKQEADKAGKRVLVQGQNGLGSLLAAVRAELVRPEEPEPKRSRATERRRRGLR